MPRIQSRLHADELQTTKQALASAVRDVQSLHECVERQQEELNSAAVEKASLKEALANAQADLHAVHKKLAELQTHHEDREHRLQDHIDRLEKDVQTLEDMVQAARRREAAMVSSPFPVDSSTTANCQQRRVSTSPCKFCAQLREELRRVREATRASSALSTTASSRPPRPPPDAPLSSSSLTTAAAPAHSAHSSYWQDQLLSTTQQAAACFDVVRRHTHDLRTCLCAGGEEKEEEREAAAAATAASSWARQLSILQRDFDDVVQADAKVIGFLVMVAEQQSCEIRRLQRQWTEAQKTASEVEAVLDEAHAHMQTQTRETDLLKAECVALTEGQRRCSAEVAAQAREVQASHAALSAAKAEQQRDAEEHTRAVAALTAELTQSRQLQQRATAYASQLEAALQDKQRLLEAAVSARNERQQQEVLAATRSRVAQFVAQLSISAQQLQTSLSPPTVSGASTGGLADAAAMPLYGSVRPKAAPSISSPEPSPPGASASHSTSLRLATRSPSSLPYDDSLFLGDLTQPFAA